VSDRVILQAKIKIVNRTKLLEADIMSAADTAANETSDKDTKPDLGLLEEDDEFEEFPAEDWTGADEDPGDVNVWEDNWDDDNVEDDFSLQLKAELERKAGSGAGGKMAESMQQ